MQDHGSVRNLERIREQDTPARMPRAAGFALLVLGGACVAFAGAALKSRAPQKEARAIDPLGDLVLQQDVQEKKRSAARLSPQDVTFPALLSDDPQPTTALAVVRSEAASAPSSSAMPPGPPPAEDRLLVMRGGGRDDHAPSLSVVPLPAQNVLESTPLITRPRDPLTQAAVDSARAALASSPAASPGHDGGYQLQVSSFHTQPEASDFAEQLRARGHKAYVVEANVDGRGTWYRVRIGPFPTQGAATAYRAAFEAKEHVVPFLLPPPRPAMTASSGSSTDP